jgi:hypothetical protein
MASVVSQSASLVLLCLTVASSTSTAVGQTPISLGAAVEVRGAEFTRARAVRELNDGRRLIVVDDAAQQISLIDVVAGTQSQVGATGDGPGEYRYVSAVFPLGGDSSLVVDDGGYLWSILDGARIVQTLTKPITNSKMLAGAACGATRDGKACLYYGTQYREATSAPKMFRWSDAESLAVVHHGIATRTSLDTVVALRGAYRWTGRVTHNGLPSVIDHPLTIPDQALLFADGWLATLHSKPLSVVWRNPAGTVAGRAMLASRRVAADDKQKAYAMQSYSPGLVKAGFKPDEYESWPAELPEFPLRALYAAPDGRVIVERMRAAGDSTTRFDVVDRKGAVSGSFSLPARYRMIGSGARSVYAVYRDSDDIEHLVQFAWPKP